MALVVEDGTSKIDAESYITVEYANIYHDNLGNADWASLTTTQKEQSLRKGTNFLTNHYTHRWLGYRTSRFQSLDWPRAFVEVPGSWEVHYLLDNIIPMEIRNACAELALKASADDLTVTDTRRVKREKVDIIEVEYEGGAAPPNKHKEIEYMLRRYLLSMDGLPMVRV